MIIDLDYRNLNIITEILLQGLDRSIYLNRFPRLIKTVKITPVFKKDKRTAQAKHTPISTLPNLSKVFEQCLIMYYVYTYIIYIYVFIYVHIYIMYIILYYILYMYIHIYTYIYIYMCLCVCVCMFVCVYF